MNNCILELTLKFEEISKRGWIESVSKGPAGGGHTFEKLIGKEIENFEIPDYGNIEIKTKSAAVNHYINMFSATPDGTYMFEIKRLYNKYGYPNKKNKSYKSFNISVLANEFTPLSTRYLFRLKVDIKDQKIFLCVFDIEMNLIEKTTFWSFELLKEKLYRKLKNLAVIETDYKKEKNIVYYKYKDIKFYNLKEFEHFINAIENGFIKINFKVGAYLTGIRRGQPHDHGTSFEINKNNLDKLYDDLK